jgi:hypothetical protein
MILNGILFKEKIFMNLELGKNVFFQSESSVLDPNQNWSFESLRIRIQGAEH